MKTIEKLNDEQLALFIEEESLHLMESDNIETIHSRLEYIRRAAYILGMRIGLS